VSSTASDHSFADQPCENQWRTEVDLNRTVNLLRSELHHWPRGRERSIQNEDVDVARSVSQFGDLSAIFKIAGNRFGGEILGKSGDLVDPAGRQHQRTGSPG
jgi:hypothetical protein